MNWRDIPSLSALRGFEAAARAGSFSAAARELNVTHAAIAQHVRHVESHLGLSLMNREGRKMALTDAGRTLAHQLTDGFQTIITGIETLRADTQNSPLSITTTPNFAENWLMPRLGHFWETYPDITLSITPNNAVIDLRRDGYDMALRYGNGDWPGLHSDYLLKGDYVIVGTPKLLGSHPRDGIADLNDVPWLFSPGTPVYRKWAIANGLDTDRTPIRELQTYSMVVAAVRAGAGVSVLIRAMVSDDIATGRLRVIREEPQERLGYYIVTPPGPALDKVTIFRKWLQQQV